MEKPYRVFCCYTREDQQFLKDLKKHLMSLEREGWIIVQADIDISPGKERKQEIDHHLETADIILLLISSDFIASDYCIDEEMRQAIARHEQGTARVIPIIIRPTYWEGMPFGKLQVLPEDAIPVSLSPDRDTAFLSITRGLRTVIQELTTNIRANQEKAAPWFRTTKEVLLYNRNQERNSMYNSDSGKYNINNNGPIQNQFFIEGGQTYYNSGQKNGVRSLEDGALALKRREYYQARLLLENAIKEIASTEKRLSAKARYLLALAVLGEKAPRYKSIVDMKKVDGLMNAAIDLDPCKAYFIAFASINRDIFEDNPRSSAAYERREAAREWRRQADSIQNTTDDDRDLMSYLECCQPDLYYQVW